MMSSRLRLDRYDALPGALARTPVRDIRTLFPNPALISLKGRRPDPLFLSLLLHGNETVGYAVLQRLHLWMGRHLLPRSLVIFVGNVKAAEAGTRMIDGEPDYNRLWQGGTGDEFDMAQEVLAEVRAAKPFAAIDLHNNTGANPLYGLMHNERAADRQLASLFSHVAMLSATPPSMLSLALSALCPAITAECGHSGVEANEDRAFDFVQDVLKLDHWRGQPDRELDVFEVIGRMELDRGASIAFEHGKTADIELPMTLEKWNFFEREAGATFARLPNGASPLKVVTETGANVTDSVFERVDDRLVLTRALAPAMLTTNEKAIRDDCLGYIMEKRSV